jgi:transcriptional regulator with XRE-family HTH domain
MSARPRPELVALPGLGPARRRAGLTQLALALASGVAQNTIAGLETGKQKRVAAATALRIAAALSVPLEALLQRL